MRSLIVSRASGSHANTSTTASVPKSVQTFAADKLVADTVASGQVHRLQGGTVNVFSRNSEDMSAKYPDIFEQLPKVPTRDEQSERLMIIDWVISIHRLSKKGQPRSS